MTTEEFQNRLENLNMRKPFKAFIMELCDGTRIKVDRPRAVAMRDDKAFFCSPDGVTIAFDVHGVSHVCASEERKKAWAEIQARAKENAKLYAGPDVGVDIIREMREGRSFQGDA